MAYQTIFEKFEFKCTAFLLQAADKSGQIGLEIESASLKTLHAPVVLQAAVIFLSVLHFRPPVLLLSETSKHRVFEGGKGYFRDRERPFLAP